MTIFSNAHFCIFSGKETNRYRLHYRSHYITLHYITDRYSANVLQSHNCLVMADNSKAPFIRPSSPTFIPGGWTEKTGFTLRLKTSFLITSTAIRNTSVPAKAEEPITIQLWVFWGTAVCSVGTPDEASWVVLLKSPLVAA